MATGIQLPVAAVLGMLLIAGCTGIAASDPAANPLAGAFYFDPGDGLYYAWLFDDDAFDPASVAELVHVLESNPDERERRIAAHRLADRCFGRSIHGLRFCWPDRDQVEAMIAAARQGRTGATAKALVPVLAKALDDPSRDVRQFIAFSFLRIGPAAVDAAPRLRAALADGDAFVRLWAARALYEITLEADLPLGASLAALTDPEPNVRTMAVYNLEQMESDARPALAQLQQLAVCDPSEDVRNQARRAVDSLGR